MWSPASSPAQVSAGGADPPARHSRPTRPVGKKLWYGRSFFPSDPGRVGHRTAPSPPTVRVGRRAAREPAGAASPPAPLGRGGRRRPTPVFATRHRRPDPRQWHTPPTPVCATRHTPSPDERWQLSAVRRTWRGGRGSSRPQARGDAHPGAEKRDPATFAGSPAIGRKCLSFSNKCVAPNSGV
jgi:hypothetical protein